MKESGMQEEEREREKKSVNRLNPEASSSLQNAKKKIIKRKEGGKKEKAIHKKMI